MAINERLLDKLPLDRVRELKMKIGAWLNEHTAEAVRRINTEGEFEPDTRAALVAAVAELVRRVNPIGTTVAKG